MEAMNVMYEVEEDRPFWKVYGLSIFMSLAVIVLLVGALVLVVFGESIGVTVADLIGLGSVFALIWSIVQWPVVALVVLFALIYYFAPAARQRFRWISPGSIVAFVFWLVFSLLFSLYASTFGGKSYNETYGSLAGVIILMLYVYYSALIMLIGAEINQVIEWHMPGGKNEGEKIPEDDRRPDVHRLNRENGEAR
jgi:membrane protein